MVLKDIREKSKGLKCDINSKVLKEILGKDMWDDDVDIQCYMWNNYYFGLNKKYKKNG